MESPLLVIHSVSDQSVMEQMSAKNPCLPGAVPGSGGTAEPDRVWSGADRAIGSRLPEDTKPIWCISLGQISKIAAQQTSAV